MTEQDENHLQLLSVFHFVVAGVTFVFGCFPMIHVAVGAFALTAGPDLVQHAPIPDLEVHGGIGEADEAHVSVGVGDQSSEEFRQAATIMPKFVGGIFIAAGLMAIAMLWTIAFLLLRAGFLIRKRRGHLFCTVTAGVSCLMMPFGTALGIFTMIVLFRPAVKTAFGVGSAS